MRTGTSQVLFGFFAALFVASQANIIVQLGPVAADLLPLQLAMSPETFRGILESWSPEELARYRAHFAWDSVHPLIYGGLLGLWTLVVHRQRPLSARALRMFLILDGTSPVLDYIENGFHIYLETNRDAINPGTVLIAGSAAGLKWFCVTLVSALLLTASIRALAGRRHSSAQAGPAPVLASQVAPGRGGGSTVDSPGAVSSKSATSTTTSLTKAPPATATPGKATPGKAEPVKSGSAGEGATRESNAAPDREAGTAQTNTARTGTGGAKATTKPASRKKPNSRKGTGS